MNDANAVKASLYKIVNDFASKPEALSAHPGKDFTRKGKFPLKDVLLFPILMERDTVDRELLKYFDYDIDAVPSQSAYIQQRAKLVPDTFKMILNEFNRSLPPPALYKNKYSLYGVDGSGFNIWYNPNDTDTFMPPSGKSKLGDNEIHVVAAYRLENKIFTDAILQPGRKKNEFSAVCSLIDNCSHDYGIPLFLTDRGFPSFNMFAHAKENEVFFLSRAKDMYVERLLGKDMPEGVDEFDVTVDRIITRSQARKYKSQPERPEIYRCVDANTRFDYINPGSGEEYPLKVRVVRVKIKEGVYENLVTNLPQEEFTKDDLRILYYFRWGIETSFSYLKHALGTIDFHCKSFKNVIHEVWARFILYNCCTAIAALAVPRQPSGSKYVYQINFSMAFKTSHDFLRQSEKEKPITVVAIIEHYICPIKPERYFERRHRYQTPLKFGYRH